MKPKKAIIYLGTDDNLNEIMGLEFPLGGRWVSFR